MDFYEPNNKGFTIYSKSGCQYCLLVKKLIKETHFFIKEINCDDYLLDRKDDFLQFIENISQSKQKTFPMIFFEGKFIGGYIQTKEFIDKLLLSFEDKF
jgi:glutaredoxin